MAQRSANRRQNALKDGYFQIGEVSKITGISKDTLHFYDRIGLVRPDHVDAENRYRYYSRKNMWQLDIVSVCRKLRVPLETVKRLLSLHDNGKIVALLSEYREEALRLSDYYRQVAADIAWYQAENDRIAACQGFSDIERNYLPRELVVIGGAGRDALDYHANLQETVKDVLPRSVSIQRKYGYLLDRAALAQGKFLKLREYLKLDEDVRRQLPETCLYALPEGMYAVFTVRIQNETADFSPFFRWLEEENEQVDQVFAEELGLQLFDYLPDYYCEVKALLKPHA